MRYVIENTEAFRILAERARARELGHAAALASGELKQVVKNAPLHKRRALGLLAAVVAVTSLLRALLPLAVRVEIAVGLPLAAALASAAWLLGHVL